MDCENMGFCKRDIGEVLKLLFNENIMPHIVFDRFGFIGKNYLVGCFLESGDVTTLSGKNNIVGASDDQTLSATFFGIIPDEEYDFIEIKGDTTLYYPVPSESKESASSLTNVPVPFYMSLDDVDAIVFKVDETFPFKTFQKMIECINNNMYGCCNFVNETNPYSLNASTTSLSAGWLYVQSVSIIGKIGCALILRNDYNIYIICEDSIGFKV
ncbi:MAG: CotA family spore coat protein [Peptostreptococcaceae bacterium]